ncbi:hypothetical protein AB1207_00980 [Kineococcus endophyticus]|uniref:Uncharacterized protein n=1 Tax=Kineococcus endophyticus TaxID=1181883 RepID=A0ABV3P114_9ACTN
MPARPAPSSSTTPARRTPVASRPATDVVRPAGRRSPRGRMLAVLQAKPSV